MSQPNRPSTPSQKWGLFLLLTGALGFTLSMNPDHFNNIARNEGPLHVTDMAQTAAAPAVKSETANAGATAKAATPAPAPAPAPKTRRLEQIKGKDSKGNDVTLDAEAVEIDGKTYITFKTDCANCNPNLKNYTLTTSSLNNVDDLRKFATDLVNKETKTETAAKKDSKENAVKVSGKATEEVDLEKWAEECENKKAAAKLTCHKKQLIKLSKYLKNDEEQADQVKDYFMSYLHSKIRDGLTEPTLKETSATDCSGQPVYNAGWGQVGCRDHEQLQDMRKFAKELAEGLRTNNGKSVAKILFDLETKSYSAQVTNSHRVAVDGKREGNFGKRDAGLSELLFFRNKGEFQNIRGDLLSAIDSMEGDGQGALRNLLDSTFTNPVTKLLAGLQGFEKSGKHILDARIEDFMNGNLIDNGTRGSRIAGEPGNLGRAGRSARKNTTLRDLFAGCPVGSISCGTTAPINTTPSIFNKVGTPGMLPGPTPVFTGTPGTPISRDASGRTRR